MELIDIFKDQILVFVLDNHNIWHISTNMGPNSATTMCNRKFKPLTFSTFLDKNKLCEKCRNNAIEDGSN